VLYNSNSPGVETNMTHSSRLRYGLEHASFSIPAWLLPDEEVLLTRVRVRKHKAYQFFTTHN
jgi:hypothetical protein